jgi:hypothetical protein
MNNSEKESANRSPEKSAQAKLESARSALERVGHINLAVVFVQLETGARLAKEYNVDASRFYISKGWWDTNIGHNDSFQTMAENFDRCYQRYVQDIIDSLPIDSRVKLDEEAESDSVGDQEDASRVQELLRQLAAGLVKAEDEVKLFAQTVQFQSDQSIEADNAEFIKDLIEYTIRHYDLQLLPEEAVKLFDHLSQMLLLYNTQKSDESIKHDDAIDNSVDIKPNSKMPQALDADGDNRMQDEPTQFNDETTTTEFNERDNQVSDNYSEEEGPTKQKLQDEVIATASEPVLPEQPEDIKKIEIAPDVTELLPVLTKPEEKIYASDEPYTFLVHVPLGSVEQRAEEIGSDRSGQLAASIVSTNHQGTFNGDGGFILTDPKKEAVRGVAAIDTGGDVDGQRTASVDELTQPAPNYDYNQVNMTFDAPRVQAVMIKCREDGSEIGDQVRNRHLKEYAIEHDLPVVRVEVHPQNTPESVDITKVRLDSTDDRLVTVSVPATEDHFFQVQVRHISKTSSVYHATPGHSQVARCMKISKFGEATQRLSTKEKRRLLSELRKLVERGELTIAEYYEIVDSLK